MSRFIDQIRKAKQARLDALQRSQEAEADEDARTQIQVPADVSGPRQSEQVDASEEDLFPDDILDESEPGAPEEDEEIEEIEGLPTVAAESETDAEGDYDESPPEMPPEDHEAVVSDLLRQFSEQDDSSLFPDDAAETGEHAEEPEPEAELEVHLQGEEPEDAPTAVAPPPVATTGGARRSRKPLFPSHLEESRDRIPPDRPDREAPGATPDEGVSRQPDMPPHTFGPPPRRRGSLEAPQWRAATGRGEPEDFSDRGAGMSRRAVPVSGPPVDPEYVKRIPAISLRPDRRVLVYYDPKHHVCEEYRLLGKNLLHTFANALPPSNKGRVVTLTSSVRGEGKTLTGINLSLTLAEDLANRVLLIDGDLRHPKSHTYAGIPTTSGLNDMLASPDPAAILEDCVQRTETGLHLLMSSPASGNPAPLLDSDRMTAILDILRERYALVIIDTPPVLLATDALTLGVKSDGMLFLFRARKTPREQIQEARQRIARLDIRLLGYVINNVRSFLPRIWSRYYYGNY